VLIGSVEVTLLVLLAIVVFGPIAVERFRVPSMIGLIAGGVLAGPFVLGWLPADGLVTDLGAIGILVLMFLAGLSFNIPAFRANQASSITYGLLGFAAPFFLTIYVAVTQYSVGFLGAALIGAMWASNTLVAYPDVRAAGLHNNRAMGAAVSAGVVADLLSLSVLAFATATAVIERESQFPPWMATQPIVPEVANPVLPLWLALPVLIGFTLWVLPRITEWFFVRVGRTRMQRFVFMIVGMAAGGTVALLGGIEGLIGAFLAGLGMNRFVPERGRLMSNLDMVGTWLLVPAFLVSIGLNIDPRLLFNIDTLRLAALFTGFVVVGKTSAAIVTGLVFRFKWHEIGAMSTLSFGQAASTLAIAQVGLQLGMFDKIVVNAAVLTIVSTALLTSYGTNFFLKYLPRPAARQLRIGEAVLVEVPPAGSDIDALMHFAGSMAIQDNGLLIPFGIAAPGQLEASRDLVKHAVEAAAAVGLDADGQVRVDDSPAEGALDLAEERHGSLLVLGWSGPQFVSDYMFGNAVDIVGGRSELPTIAARILRPWQRIFVATGNVGVDWHAEDAEIALAVVRALRHLQPVPAVAITPVPRFVEGKLGAAGQVEVVHQPEEREAIIGKFGANDLVITPAHVIHDLPPYYSWRVAQRLADVNMAVIAGAHRMTLSKGVVNRLVRSMVRPHA